LKESVFIDRYRYYCQQFGYKAIVPRDPELSSILSRHGVNRKYTKLNWPSDGGKAARDYFYMGMVLNPDTAPQANGGFSRN
jgi:hypothetical protein